MPEKRRTLVVTVVLLIIAGLYVLTMPTQFLVGDEDAIIRDAASDSPWFSTSRHLLLRPLQRSLLALSDVLGIESHGFVLIEILNVTLGIVCLALFYGTARLLAVPHGLSLAFTALVGLSFGHWEHSFCPEVAIYSQFFHMLTLYFFVRYLTLRRRKELHLILMLAAGSASALFTSYMAVFVPLMILVLLWDWRVRRDVALAKLLVISVVVTVVMGVCPFVAAAVVSGCRSLPEFWGYMSSVEVYAVRLQHVTSHFGPERFLRSFAGMVRVFWGVGDGLTAVKLLGRGAQLRGVTNWDFAGLGFGLLLLFLLGVLSIRGFFSDLSRHVKAYCVGVLLLIYALGTYFLGSDPLVWVPGIPAFAILAAAGSKRLVAVPGRARVYWVTFAIVLLITLGINLPPRGVPSIIAPNGWHDMRVAKQFAPRLQAGDLFVTPGGGHSWIQYMHGIHAAVPETPQFWLAESDAQDVVLLNLVWSPHLNVVGPGENFLAEMDRIVEAQLKQNHRVLIDGITGPKLVQQYGSWQMFQSVRGVSREQFVEHLNRKYVVRSLPDSPGGSLSVIEPPHQ